MQVMKSDDGGVVYALWMNTLYTKHLI